MNKHLSGSEVFFVKNGFLMLNLLSVRSLKGYSFPIESHFLNEMFFKLDRKPLKLGDDRSRRNQKIVNFEVRAKILMKVF